MHNSRHLLRTLPNRRNEGLRWTAFGTRFGSRYSVSTGGAGEAAHTGRDSFAHVSADADGFGVRDVDEEEK